MRLLSAVKLFATLALLDAYLSARGSSYQRVHEYVSTTKARLAARAYVGSSIEHLSPQSRRDGGFGVVTSVDGPNQVTLAAGYTLGAAGRCRLWDVSGAVHLDAGGVEWRRSGTTVYLPDTTGTAAGDVVYSERLEVTSYAHAVAIETALGTSFNGEIRLVNATNGSVILRRVVRGGAWTSVEVDFSKVTATPNGVAASAAGTTVVLSAGHSVATLANILRVWNTTDGTSIADVASGSWSVSGNDVTVPAATATAVAAALGAAKVVRVWVEGVSELCIGGSTCAIILGAGGACAFTGAAIAWPAQTSICEYAMCTGLIESIRVEHGGIAVADAANNHATWGRSIAGDIARWGYVRSSAGAYRLAIQTATSTFANGTAAVTGANERILIAGGLAFGIVESLPLNSPHAASNAWATAETATRLSQSIQGFAVSITRILVS